MAKTVQFDFTIETAFGTKLVDMGKQPIPVSSEYSHAETVDDLDKDEKTVDEKELLQIRNAARKAAARAKDTAAALDKAGVEKPTAKDDNVAVREMAKVFKARGDSEEVATQKARAALGL